VGVCAHLGTQRAARNLHLPQGDRKRIPLHPLKDPCGYETADATVDLIEPCCDKDNRRTIHPGRTY
jgi:hypothetical protein